MGSAGDRPAFAALWRFRHERRVVQANSIASGVVACRHASLVERVEPARHRADRPGRDRLAIDTDDPQDLGAGAGEEDLIGAKERLAADRQLLGGDSSPPGALQDEVARDAGQERRAFRRGAHHAPGDDKEVAV